MAAIKDNVFRIKSNASVHGLAFAARQYKVECKREGKVDNFDTFYFACFGRYPAKKERKIG